MSEKGVFKAVKKDGSTYYRVSICYKNKHISLGSFSEENQAVYAYQNAFDIINNSEISLTSLLSDQNSYELKLDKIISLVNFRDNGIYSPNPIYISKNIIYYYLSTAEVLKFDKDDLFYYSTHHIQKRGNHLFVTDLGQQINLSSRYGIKNHAVLNKDYRFINGDIYDYRYSNIEILNEYHGVHLVEDAITKISKNFKRKKQIYKALIHINGNYLIGYYDSKEKAAIAYNKAADLLSKNGCKKNYPRNQISKMSVKKYNSIYEKIEISSELNKLSFND